MEAEEKDERMIERRWTGWVNLGGMM